MTEVKENLNVNFQGFLALVEQRNEKVCSIAPINGIESRTSSLMKAFGFPNPRCKICKILK